MLKILISIFSWASAIIISVVMYFVMLFTTILFLPFDKNRKIAHIQATWWAEGISAAIPWHVDVSGLENIRNDKAYVIIANHKSMADIFIMYKIRTQFKWVSKESVFKTPFVGWMMSLCKYIKLSRGKFSSIKKTYREASGWLKKGISVIFFPEGTRSESPEMKDFQNGPFKIAIKEKAPVLPVCIKGTQHLLRKGSWLCELNTRCSIKVLPPIDTAQFGPGDFEHLKDMAYARISEVS